MNSNSKENYPIQGKISLQDREKQNQHKGAVLWLTGIPASGKSTIAIELEYLLFQRKVKTFILDGDNIRQGLSSDLNFSLQDRIENIRRVAEVARLFCEAGMIVLVAVISPCREKRDEIREIIPKGRFIEIFVDCHLEECERRDPKGLYAKARKGEVLYFTGISSPYEKPLHPEIYLNTAAQALAQSVDQILRYLIDHELIPK